MKIICKETCMPVNKAGAGNGWTFISSIVFLFMPKCALCWAAYMSLFSSLGITVSYRPWFQTVAVVLFFATLIKLLITAISKKNYTAFILALIAGMLIIFQKDSTGMNAGKLFALMLMAVAVLLDKFIYLYKQFMLRRSRNMATA